MSEKVGKLLTCDRCGNTAFKENIGEGAMNDGFTHFLIYEDTPDGWSKMSDKLIPCKHIFSNGSEFEWFIETQCKECKRFRNGKCKIYNACWEARWDEKKFPYEYLLEYEHYAGKRCKKFTDMPIKRKRRENIIPGQTTMLEYTQNDIFKYNILTPNEARQMVGLSSIKERSSGE